MPINVGIEAGNSNIEKFTIQSNYAPFGTKPENFASRCPELILYESLFDTTVRAKANFVDAGYNPSDMTAQDFEFSMVAGEKTEIIVKDSQDNKLEYIGDYHLRTRKNQREHFSSPSNTYTNFYMDFWSKESMENHLVEKRATKKFEGLPHDHVKELITDILGTKKNIEVDNTILPYNFIGYSEKVFHHVINLCNKSCNKDPGVLAGFLFYEVAKGTNCSGGYRFKSIDILLEQPPKKKYIYNNTVGVPEGYDSKIVNFYENVSANAESEILSGATFKRQLRRFDPSLKTFVEDDFDGKSQKGSNAAKNYYKIASDLNLQDKSTRISSKVWDVGSLPHGKKWDEQKTYSKDLKGLGNYLIDDLVRQSVDRVNQLLGTQITILIPMDLSLHVGDIIECDFPQIDPKKDKKMKNRSGNYIVLDLAHRITPKTSYTSLHLSRDATINK
jgi:hypothetical protein